MAACVHTVDEHGLATLVRRAHSKSIHGQPNRKRGGWVARRVFISDVNVSHSDLRGAPDSVRQAQAHKQAEPARHAYLHVVDSET